MDFIKNVSFSHEQQVLLLKSRKVYFGGNKSECELTPVSLDLNQRLQTLHEDASSATLKAQAAEHALAVERLKIATRAKDNSSLQIHLNELEHRLVEAVAGPTLWFVHRTFLIRFRWLINSYRTGALTGTRLRYSTTGTDAMICLEGTRTCCRR